jgi:hypothetical protein
VKHLLFAAAVVALACCQAGAGHAQILTGSVTSAEEGAMEGALVSAQQTGSPITVTVVSDEHGRFRFPDRRLAPGHYALRIRAIGYELDGPQAVDLGAAATDIALELRKTADLAAQLTNSEWFMSMPGTPEQKRPLIECMKRFFPCSSVWRNTPTIRRRRGCNRGSPSARCTTIWCASSPPIWPR